MNSKAFDLRARTKDFALKVIAWVSLLPRDTSAQVIGKQLLRSATSIGAHVREGKHSRSEAELFSKISVGLQEAEETRHWLELLTESGIVDADRLESLLEEADELVAILFTSTKTLKHKLR